MSDAATRFSRFRWVAATLSMSARTSEMRRSMSITSSTVAAFSSRTMSRSSCTFQASIRASLSISRSVTSVDDTPSSVTRPSARRVCMASSNRSAGTRTLMLAVR